MDPYVSRLRSLTVRSPYNAFHRSLLRTREVFGDLLLSAIPTQRSDFE